MEKRFDLDTYAALARQAGAEGAVLLKNDAQALPLEKGTRVAVFGRSQFGYYKSGTGSGGLVNAPYVVSILDALKASKDLSLNAEVLRIYEDWQRQHPLNDCYEWGGEPWCQEEMPLSEDVVRAASCASDAAVVMIGRTAGEDRDHAAEEGSYLLTREEERMLQLVCRWFSRSIVLLNTGCVMDMKWVARYQPAAVLYVWQGGQEGGNAVLDVLTGRVNPCGRLTDTIAEDIADVPSSAWFGDPKRNFYVEDIYLGYRYFETFAREKVLYPFGFGLSYTTFSLRAEELRERETDVRLCVTVQNTGARSGKEVVQVYCQPPQGLLGKPARILCGFAKTRELQPGETQTLEIVCAKYALSSYDDSGRSGHRFCYVLEAGAYQFFLGGDVRNAQPVGGFTVAETVVVQQLKQAMAPITAFRRWCNTEGTLTLEDTPLCLDSQEQRQERLPQTLPYTGNLGHRLQDVAEGRVSMDAFVAQMDEDMLCALVRGEGMCSPKVTPGTAGAIGGTTPQLAALGIPVACCSDGPSGIRMDCGLQAYSLPCGTCLASTFNEELISSLYEMTALEMRKSRIDMLLGPGMNLHRNPLNGRNFEYFSEDPFLTGKMAAAQLRGLNRFGVTGVIKHFACNNQEYCRNDAEAVVSERALRELYLKGFEIAVKEGPAFCVMSTYGPVNGLWTASNADLLTAILREEWGFDGLVMTDWWAKGNEPGKPGSRQEVAAMVRSQNDVYMVVTDAASNSGNDNLKEALADGRLTLAEMRRSAANICRVLMRLPAYERFCGIKNPLDSELDQCASVEDASKQAVTTIPMEREAEIPVGLLACAKGQYSMFHMAAKEPGTYALTLELCSQTENDMAQMSVSIFRDKEFLRTISLSGQDRTWHTETIEVGRVLQPGFDLRFFWSMSGMAIRTCRVRLLHAEW